MSNVLIYIPILYRRYVSFLLITGLGCIVAILFHLFYHFPGLQIGILHFMINSETVSIMSKYINQYVFWLLIIFCLIRLALMKNVLVKGKIILGPKTFYFSTVVLIVLLGLELFHLIDK